MEEILQSVVDYAFSIGGLEFLGLVFGLLAVYYLIKQNILTWLTGILYVLVSFVIFWKARLYADLGLHVIFLVLNIYGWIHWVKGADDKGEELPVTFAGVRISVVSTLFTIIGVIVLGFLLDTYTDASLAYWDSTTTVMSIVAMWMTARKYIENWIIWLIVDVLASGIYVYKEIYFYAILYLIYIGMAISGYLAWRKSMLRHETV